MHCTNIWCYDNGKNVPHFHISGYFSTTLDFLRLWILSSVLNSKSYELLKVNKKWRIRSLVYSFVTARPERGISVALEWEQDVSSKVLDFSATTFGISRSLSLERERERISCPYIIFIENPSM